MVAKPQERRSATAVAWLETDEQLARRVADLFAESYADEDIAVVSHETGNGRWNVAIHFQGSPDRQAVRTLTALAVGPAVARTLRFERIETKDWVRESFVGLKPVDAGRFIVHGAHDRGGVAANRIGIEIEAALAFGTGHHGTTRGCLLALDRICKSMAKPRAAASAGKGRDWVVGWRTRPRFVRAKTGRHGSKKIRPRMLDLGTGSGVLAIAAARALRRRVLATDIDGSAVQAARDNAQLNRVGALVEVVRADGLATRRVCSQAPFDLILANILLAPLQRLAAPLTKLAAPGGRVVLSGLLTTQARAAIAAYHELALERCIALDGWITLILMRRVRPSARSRNGVARRHRAS